MARAGRMRPNTMSPGILTTPRVRPVSTITLSTTLVKRPKKAFQSPGTHQRTGCSAVVTLAIRVLLCALAWTIHQRAEREAAGSRRRGEGCAHAASPARLNRSPAGCAEDEGVPLRLSTPLPPTPPGRSHVRQPGMIGRPRAARPYGARDGRIRSHVRHSGIVCVLARGGQRLEEVPGMRDPAEDATLRLDHGEGRLLELGEVRGDAVLQDEAVVSAIVGLAHGGVYAHFGSDPAHHEVADAAMFEDAVEVRGVEGALTRLVHHRLPRLRIELLYDVVPLLATHEDATHGPGIADARGEPPSRLLGRRAAGEIGPMALARVDDEEPARACGLEHLLGGRHGAAQQGDVVAEGLAEAAGVDEVALEVDHQKGRGVGMELVLVRLGDDGGHGHIPPGAASTLLNK